MKKAEPREKDAALAARQQAEERDVMRQRRIRNRKLLETEEPVVFEVLSRACAGELAHAYLLSGPRNALKSDAAVLLAASILLHADHLIDEEAINKMKDSVMLVNTARGPLIDSDALIRALKKGKFYSIDCILNYELIRELCSFGSDVIVLSPEHIQKAIRCRIKAMKDSYDNLRT